MIPRLAIISQNILEATGLKSILEDVIPMADVTVFNSIEVLKDENDITPFAHFFVSSQMLVNEMDFFLEHIRQTIVLISRNASDNVLGQFLTINTNVDQHELIKTIFRLHSKGHANNRHPGIVQEEEEKLPISGREAEVLALVAKG